MTENTEKEEVKEETEYQSISEFLEELRQISLSIFQIYLAGGIQKDIQQERM